MELKLADNLIIKISYLTCFIYVGNTAIGNFCPNECDCTQKIMEILGAEEISVPRNIVLRASFAIKQQVLNTKGAY